MIGGTGRVARIVAKRAAHDWLMLAAAVITVLMATTLLAAGPIYADAVTLGSLQKTIVNAEPGEANVSVKLSGKPEDYATFDEVVGLEAANTFRDIGHVAYRHMSAEAFDLETGRSDLDEIGVFRSTEAIDQFTTLVDGRWPSNDGSRLEAALHEGAATWLGIGAGTEIEITSRRDNSLQIEVLVVGVYEVDDLSDPYWLDDGLALAGISESRTLRSLGPFVVTPEQLLGRLSPVRASYEWRIFPSFENLTPAGISMLGRSMSGLQDRLDGGLADRSSLVSALSTVFTVETNLETLLRTTATSLTVTRSGVLMLSAQLAILAAYALFLTAGLLVETRKTETNLLRSRGASNSQLLWASLAEGVLITVPAALIAPWIAVWALEALNDFGPLATANLDLSPLVNTASYVVAFGAALICTLALAVPTYRSARAFAKEPGGGREDARGGAQRLGVDLALVTLAAFAFWQLRSFGARFTSEVSSGLSVDPVLVAAPAIGLLAGGTLALRTVPLISRSAERAAARGKATVVALSAWQVSRRPRRYARSALLLVMAVAIGLFAASYTTTWSQSQADRADFRTGADVRVTPDRRANQSIPDIHLHDAYASVEGVAASMAVAQKSGLLARSEGIGGRYVMLDSTQAASLMNIREDLVTTDFGDLMSRLQSQRPSVATIELPGSPDQVAVVVDVVVDDFPDAFPEEMKEQNEINPSIRVVVQDADGLLHKLALVPLAPGEGPTETVIPLTHTADGRIFRPNYPISLVDVEIFNLTPPDFARGFDVFIHEMSVSSQGDRQQLPDVLKRETWETTLFVNGRFRTRPSMGLPPPIEESGLLHIRLESGDTAPTLPVPVHFSLRPAGTNLPATFPVVVTEGFLEATSTQVGDTLQLGLVGVENDRAEIVGTMLEFPTVDPALAEAVIIDLPTFQMLNYRVGTGIERPDEYWLELGDSSPVTETLLSSPFSSATVSDRTEEADLLRTDPIALGAVASLSLGFLAAAVFAAVGFTVSATVSARERITEFALLRALGLSNKQLGSWLILEQGALVVVSLVFGTIVGLLLASLILPLISITQGGVAAVPTPVVIVPVQTIAQLDLALVGALILIVAVLGLTLRRLGLGSLLRIGDD